MDANSRKRAIALLEYSSEDEDDGSPRRSDKTLSSASAPEEADPEIAPEVLDQLPEDLRTLTRELVIAERSLETEIPRPAVIQTLAKTEIEQALLSRKKSEEDEEDDNWLAA